MKKTFEEVYSDFQCAMIAQLNKYNMIGGISATQYHIMDILRMSNDPLTTTEIAKRMHVSTAAISRQVKRLLELELVEQKRVDEDRRNLKHYITSKGEGFITNADNCRFTMMDVIKKALSKDELKTFTQLCDTILSNVKQESN